MRNSHSANFGLACSFRLCRFGRELVTHNNPPVNLPDNKDAIAIR
jgi:hypothetical protein